MTAKLLIQKHLLIGALIWEEAIQCALVSAELLNDQKLIDEIKEIYNNDFERSKSTPIAKYYNNKTAEQMQLFENKLNQNQ